MKKDVLLEGWRRHDTIINSKAKLKRIYLSRLKLKFTY